jgi:hypothetical protein
MKPLLKPMRWFRFRLRTALLIVTLLAIPCAWIGSEWKIVRERAALIDSVRAHGGAITTTGFVTSNAEGWTAGPGIKIEAGDKRPPISIVRRWLGDQDVSLIVISSDFPDSDEQRILGLFPGTDLVKLPVFRISTQYSQP